MNYRSIAQLAASVSRWSMSLPGDIDLVVGVPRSGLLAANLLALYRNLPFTDLEGYCEGRVLAGGRRAPDSERRAGGARKVLVVDDSFETGGAMAAARSAVADRANSSDRVQFAAVYVSRGARRVGARLLGGKSSGNLESSSGISCITPTSSTPA